MECTNKRHSDETDFSADGEERLALLVRKAQSGDHAAFHQLVEKFQAKIFRSLYYRTHSSAEAEDLTQDVFLSAFKNLSRLKSPPLFRPWLYRIAVNRVRDYYRRKKLKTMLGFTSIDEADFQEPAAPETGEAKAFRRETFWARVREIMDSMSRFEKEVFYLRFFDELTIREIASVLNKNQSTVKTLLYRALAKVKSAPLVDDLLEGL